MKSPFFRRAAALALCAALCLLPASAVGMASFTTDGPYAPFSDLVPDGWYFDDVCTVRALGIMDGKPGGRFDPLGSLSVAEAVTMAAKARSIYAGGGFTPGGDPWYQNAVGYALSAGILRPGEFADYTRPATRAEMAALFARALPVEEYGRVNRISAIPDVGADTAYADEIHLLYAAGVLTGDASGAFSPTAQVTRAEAAAIIGRSALPERRRAVNLSTPAAGTVETSLDGASFTLSLPAGWTGSDPADGFTQLYAQSADGTANVYVLKYAKADYPGADAAAVAGGFLNLQSALPGYALGEAPADAIFRGLPGAAFSFTLTEEGAVSTYRGWVVENSASWFILLAGGGEAGRSVLYTLDLAL